MNRNSASPPLVAAGSSVTEASYGARHRGQDSGNSASGQVIPRHGHLLGDVWVKRVCSSRHLLRQPLPSWAVDANDALAALKHGIEWVCIEDAETGREFWVTVSRLIERGELFEFLGYGLQLRLPISAWASSQEAAQAPEQLSLFQDVGRW